MSLIELKNLIAGKLGIDISIICAEPFNVRFRYHGNTYRVSVMDLSVEKVDGACLVTDSDTQQLEKLLRGEQWDGTGLPPVGTECEYEDSNGKRVHVEIMYLSKWVIVMRSKENDIGNGVDIAKDLVMDKMCQFYPLRTECDKAVEQMIEFHRNTLGSHDDSMRQLYDAIVAVKIDGLGKVG